MTLIEFLHGLDDRGVDIRHVEVYNPESFSVWVTGISVGGFVKGGRAFSIFTSTTAASPLPLPADGQVCNASITGIHPVPVPKKIFSSRSGVKQRKTIVGPNPYAKGRLQPRLRISIKW